MSTGAWVVVAAVALAVGFGAYRALTDGRFRGTRRLPVPVEEGAVRPAPVVEEGAVRRPPVVEEGAVRPAPVVEEGAVRPAPVVEEGALAPVSKPPTSDLWDDVLAAVPDARLGVQATLLQFSSAFCAPCRATRRTLAEVADVVPGVTHLEVDAEHHLELVRRLRVLRTPTTIVLDPAGREVTRASGAPRKEQVIAALGGL